MTAKGYTPTLSNGDIPLPATPGAYAARVNEEVMALWARAVGIFTPEQYGAVGDGTTDDTTAFVNMATAVRAAGGGAVEFAVDKSYAVYPSPSAATNTLLDFTGCEGLRVNFNGSRIITAGSWTGGKVLRVFHIDNCYDVEINGYNVEQTTTLSPSITNGLMGIFLRDTNRDIRVNGFYQKYGRSCIESVRSTELAVDSRTRGVTINGLISDNVEYGLSFQKNGDQVFARGVKGINCGRLYFPYNVRQHDVEIESTPGSSTAQDVLVGVYTDHTESAISNTLADIRVRYTSREQSAAPPGFTALFIQQQTSTTAAGLIRNVSFELDIRISSSSFTGIAFELFKQAFGAGADSTTRNHVLENVRLSGSLVGFANNVDLVNIGQTGTWGSETVRNINFRDLTSTGSGTGKFKLDATGFTTALFENVAFAHDLTFTNDPGGGTIVFGDNVTFANNSAYVQLGKRGTWTPTLTFATPGNQSISYAAQRGWWRLDRNGILTVGFAVQTSGFTHTTASGELRVLGLPFPSSTLDGYGSANVQGITKANFTMFTLQTQSSQSYLRIAASGSGQVNGTITHSDVPSGGTVLMSGVAQYIV